MIDIKELEKSYKDSSPESYYQRYVKSLKGRGGDVSLIEKLLDLNKIRRKLILETETLKASQNKASEEIAKLKRQKADASEQIKGMQALSKQIKDLHTQEEAANLKVHDLALTLPNHCHETTPEGSAEEDNVEVRKCGDIREYSFEPKDHAEIGSNLGMLDMERAAKVAGARFFFLVGPLAQMERALINYMIDVHSKDHGYQEIWPPYIVNSNALVGTSQFPKFKEDVFHLQDTDYHLIPTAEVPVTNYFAGEILKEEDLPIQYAAFSPCFRSEAGSHGKDTKGLIRVHQFHKVELLKFAHPDKSYEEHEALTSHAEKILSTLELPYRVVSLCTGDIGFAAAKCYDLEVWLPGQKLFREISSCSNFEDFQARRANIRFRPKGGKPQFVHTLNGSGLAVGRTLVAILENYQQEDGSVRIPEVLQPYMGGKKLIEKL